MFSIKKNFLSVLFALMVVVATMAVFYKFYFIRDYTFTVEIYCDPSVEECLERDCEAEECPPNGFETYQTYSISASDFQFCTNDDCRDFCRNNPGQCELVSGEE